MARIARAWWPSFLFHTTDVENAARILESGKLLSRSRCENLGLLRSDSASRQIIEHTDPAWKEYVRLYFRPRTPFQYRNEGLRPVGQRGSLEAHCPVPVVFLFDSATVLTRHDTLFSEGNLASNPMVGGDAAFFERLPFEEIYHDTWLSEEEKRSIVFHRHAEVIVPNELDLAPVRRIWCRSPAELETLESLVTPAAWAAYRQRVGSSARPNLFFRRWTYVERVDLTADRAHIRFNPSSLTPGPFQARLEFDLGGQYAVWTDDAFSSARLGSATDLIISLSAPQVAYSVRLTLDGSLAHAGSYAREEDLLDLLF